MVPEQRDTLPEQMRALLPDDSSAVTADEAMAIAAIRANGETAPTRADRARVPLRRLNPTRSGRPAWAWLAVIAVLAVVLVLGFKALPSSKPSGAPASRSNVPVTSTTTTIPRHVTAPTKPTANTWPMRTIVQIGTAQDIGQDIAPTADGVYWLTDTPTSIAPAPTVNMPFRYIPASGRVIGGTSITGTVGSPAITVTGGWVWAVVGVGDDAVVEQLDTSTLALISRESLPVKDNLFGPGVDPVLTATVDGPLWVAGGEDLWALNPSTGAIETEFNTGNEITSMSTDPTGTLLYTGAEGSRVRPGSHRIQRTDRSRDEAGIPTGLRGSRRCCHIRRGSWVSFRTGMAGESIELSANGLSQIAPPPQTNGAAFGTYHEIGGVGASVSEGTLWVTSPATGATVTLTCADPATGTVRASDSVQRGVEDFIASGSLLYVFHDNELVGITPPAKCFG